LIEASFADIQHPNNTCETFSLGIPHRRGDGNHTIIELGYEDQHRKSFSEAEIVNNILCRLILPF